MTRLWRSGATDSNVTTLDVVDNLQIRLKRTKYIKSKRFPIKRVFLTTVFVLSQW